jgi:uroporphyrinogen-III synthase
VDWLTFTSPSTVRNFITLTRRAGLNPFQLAGSPRVACIGPVTAEAARELGFRVDAVAEPHTAEGLLAAIQAHINDRLPDYR